MGGAGAGRRSREAAEQFVEVLVSLWSKETSLKALSRASGACSGTCDPDARESSP